MVCVNNERTKKLYIYIYYICPELAFMNYRFRSGKGAWPL